MWQRRINQDAPRRFCRVHLFTFSDDGEDARRGHAHPAAWSRGGGGGDAACCMEQPRSYSTPIIAVVISWAARLKGRRRKQKTCAVLPRTHRRETRMMEIRMTYGYAVCTPWVGPVGAGKRTSWYNVNIHSFWSQILLLRIFFLVCQKKRQKKVVIRKKSISKTHTQTTILAFILFLIF